MGLIEDIIRQSQLNQITPEQRRMQAAITGGAGLADLIVGGIGQRRAEQDIEGFGAEADAIRQQMKDVRAPSIMSPENQAAAVRNAAILSAGQPQEDSSELAAAKMAMDAGADPTKIQRALTEAEAKKDERARLEQQSAFREGLGYASQDAMSEYQKQMQDLGMDYEDTQAALNMAQQQSLMNQQQKQKGIQGLTRGATQFLTSGGMDAIGNLFGGGDEATVKAITDATTAGTGVGQGGGLLDILANQANGGKIRYEDGGVVQKTPGVFKHDDGDGIYEEGENEIFGFAQTAKGFEDTGIRMTGGEFVINPEQAEGMEKAYDRIKRKKDPSRADLMALYEAVRFLDDPQFD
tara:strand:+ start:1188 stop:2240 length:1053 start_codon:yes stop_codon:yes gene_type:complete